MPTLPDDVAATTPRRSIARRARRAATRRLGPRVREATWRWRADPDFLIIGAQKSGTTSLYSLLADHPDVERCLLKEPTYFACLMARGEPWYRSLFPTSLRLARPWSPGRRRALTGEASTYYLAHPFAAERVAQRLPGVRIVVVLREPAERSVSQYGHEVRQGREHRTFDEAITAEAQLVEAEERRIARGDERRFAPHELQCYVHRSQYGPQLERWFAALPSEQILVLRFEDLFGEAQRRELDRVAAFLGLAPIEGDMPFRNRGARSGVDEAALADLRRRFEASNEVVERLTTPARGVVP
jgi:hypothetical protein